MTNKKQKQITDFTSDQTIIVIGIAGTILTSTTDMTTTLILPKIIKIEIELASQHDGERSLVQVDIDELIDGWRKYHGHDAK